MKYLFRNDYSFGAHPKVLEALAATNLEGNPGYGDDPYCARAAGLIRRLCASNAQVEFLTGGTQVNFTAIAAFLRPWEGVICAASGHINGHEAGAVEATGHKLICLPAGRDGKLTPAAVAAAVKEYESPHVVRPGLAYISQATENGAVYTKAELEALSDTCMEHQLLLYVDGARLGCALASEICDVTLSDLARLTDAFTIGGTKNGALMGEALVINNPALGKNFFRLKKQRGGVLAKGWLLGVQFDALFTDGLYQKLGKNAIETAERLREGFREKGFSFYLDTPTNQIFLAVDRAQREDLARKAAFSFWEQLDEERTVIRFVTSWATRMEDVEELIRRL